jgi:hypothetical protein
MGGGLLRRYVHGPAVDEPLARYEGSGQGDRRYLYADMDRAGRRPTGWPTASVWRSPRPTA